MRYFASSSFHISSLAPGLKLVVSLYLLTVLMGLGFSAAKFMQRMDLTTASVESYYLGDGSDEELGIFGDEEVGEPPKSNRFLVDVAHPHMFTVPLILLVICHLAHLSRINVAVLATLDIGAFFGFFSLFGVPWFLSAAPGFFGPVMIIGGTLLTVCLSALCLIALVSMWWRRPRVSKSAAKVLAKASPPRPDSG
jgi:hypothetical protein